MLKRKSNNKTKRPAILAYCSLLIAHCLLLIVSSCGTTSNVLAPSANDLSKLKTDFPNATVADLEKGFTLYKSTCSGCHVLHLPKEKTREQWAKILPEMFQKTSLKAEEQKQIKQYLFAKAN